MGATGVRPALAVALASSTISSLLRFGAGRGAPPAKAREPVILYDFEGCPYCRIAREAISEAGVPALVRPCPKRGERFRPAVIEQGGKARFPYLVDPNAGVAMYESADIARHVRRTYGRIGPPFVHWLGPFNLFLSQFATLARGLAGTWAKPSRAPARPLEFFGAENDPRGRLARELLSELELEYVWWSRPMKGKRAPLLIDPNENAQVTGAHSIRAYLQSVYGAR